MENQVHFIESGSSFMTRCHSSCLNDKDFQVQPSVIGGSPEYTNNNNISNTFQNHQNIICSPEYIENSFTVKQDKMSCIETNENTVQYGDEIQNATYNVLHQPDSSTIDTVYNAENEKNKKIDSDCPNHGTENHLDKKRLDRLQKDRERKRKLRQNPEYRAMERFRDSERHRRLRMDPEYRETERKRNSEHHRMARQNPEYKARERARDLERHKRLRNSPEYKEKESLRNAEHYQTACLKREYLQTMDNIKHDTALMSVLKERFNTTELDLFSLISSGWLS